jgi:hypothetical protein
MLKVGIIFDQKDEKIEFNYLFKKDIIALQ